MTTTSLFPESPAAAAQRAADEHRARIASLIAYVARLTVSAHERHTLTTALEQLDHQLMQDLTIWSGLAQQEAR